MKVKIEEALYDIQERLEQLDKKVGALDSKVNISMDALENKIKELEQLIVAIDDDYYELRKEMLNKLTAVNPYIDEIKKIGEWKKEVIKEVRQLEEAVEKMGKIVVRFNEDLTTIKKILRMR